MRSRSNSVKLADRAEDLLCHLSVCKNLKEIKKCDCVRLLSDAIAVFRNKNKRKYRLNAQLWGR